MGKFISSLALSIALLQSTPILATPNVNFNQNASELEAQIYTQILPSGYRVSLVGPRILLYNLENQLVARGYLTVIYQQLQEFEPSLLSDLESYMLETLAFLDAQVLEIGQLTELIQSLTIDLNIPNFWAQQGSDLVFVGSFTLSNGNEIWVYNWTGPNGSMGVFRVNSATGEGRFTPNETGNWLQNPDGSTGLRNDGSSEGGGDSEGQGGEEDEDDIFIPPPDHSTGGSGGHWGDGSYASGPAMERLQSLQDILRKGKLELTLEEEDWTP